MTTRHKALFMLMTLMLLSGCTQYMFESGPEPCTPASGLPRECVQLIQPLLGEMDREFLEGYAHDPVLSNVSRCEAAAKELAGMEGCTRSAFEGLKDAFLSELKVAVMDVHPSVDPLLVGDTLDGARACSSFTCAHAALMIASGALRLEDLASGLRNGTAPSPEELATLSSEERERFLDYPALKEGNLTGEAGRLASEIKAADIGGLTPSSPKQAYVDHMVQAENDLAAENGRWPTLVATRMLPAGIAGCLLIFVIIVVYDRKYRAQIEFWKTFTSATNITHPRSVATGALGASIALALVGAALMFLGRG